MWEYLGPILLYLLILTTAIAWDLHARWVFIALGYTRVHHHGKTFKRAANHYKTHWSFGEKLLWAPVFAEYYPAKYRAMAILSYIHYALAAITITLFVASDISNRIPDLRLVICFVIFTVFTIGRFIHTNAIARSKI